jgi:hypothetical protein
MNSSKFDLWRECYSCAAKVGAFMVVLAIASYFVDGLTVAAVSLFNFVSATTSVVGHYVAIVMGCKYMLIPLSAISLWSSCFIVKICARDIGEKIVIKLLAASLISTMLYGASFVITEDVHGNARLLAGGILILMILAMAAAVVICDRATLEKRMKYEEQNQIDQ